MSGRTSKKAPKLRRLQEWMAHVTRHRDLASVAVRSKAAREHFSVGDVMAGGVVVPNDRMSVTDRLQVYNGAYLGRLIEVLETDFPALQHLLGHEEWRRLAATYVDRHPSQDPNLNHFNRHLPEFCKRRRDLPHRAFTAELAALEHGIAEAFSAPDFEPMDAARLGAVDPDDWSRARLVCNASLRLFAFRYPVNAYYIAFREDEEPSPPEPARSYTAVFRKEHRVWRAPLQREGHAVLTALASGEPLAQALDRARGHESVGQWFQTWAADGLFTDIVIGRR